MTALTIDLTTDRFTPIPEGTPATIVLGWTASAYPAIVVKVERFKSGSRASLVKTITVKQVSFSGRICGVETRFIVKPDGQLTEVGNAWNHLNLGIAEHRPYWD